MQQECSEYDRKCKQQIAYLTEKGYAIVYLRPGTKQPFQHNWATRPVLPLDTLLTQYRSGYNIGVRLGTWSQPRPGHGAVVLDVDIELPEYTDEALATYDRLCDGIIPPTVLSGSGMGSRHGYFTCPLHLLPTKAATTIAQADVMVMPEGARRPKPVWKIEVLSTGKQAVVPPSVHPDTGNAYVWRLPIFDVPMLPQAVFDALQTDQCTPEHAPTVDGFSGESSHPFSSNTFTCVKGFKALKDPDLKSSQNQSAEERDVPRKARTSADVMALLEREDVALKIMCLLGLDGVKIGQAFRCVLHPENHPSASIAPPTETCPHFSYMDWHCASERQNWPLACVYKTVMTRTDICEMPKPMLLAWTIRMLQHAGVLAYGDVPHPPVLPEDVPGYITKVYEGFLRLLGAKWAIEQAPSPYTHRFAADWCGVTEYDVRRAIPWLLKRGYLVTVDKFKGMALFVMGTIERVRRFALKIREALRHPLGAIANMVRGCRPAQQEPPPTETQAATAYEPLELAHDDWEIREIMRSTVRPSERVVPLLYDVAAQIE